MASEKKTNWQGQFKTIKEKHEFLLNNELLSDITFTFEKAKISDGQEDEKMFAHKWILSLGSSVFYETFLKNEDLLNSDIPVTDVTFDVFYEFLKYLYIDECSFTENNVIQILYLSKKYLIPFLEEDCIKYISENLEIDAMCDILKNALEFGYEDITKKCILYIKPIFPYLLKTDKILSINKPTLETLFNLNEVGPCTEFDLFTCGIKWSTAECLRKGITANGTNKRLILGDIIKCIRFPLMSFEEFGKVVTEEGLLTDKEISAIYINIATKKKNTLGFGTEERKSYLDKIKPTFIDLFDKSNTQKFPIKNETTKFVVHGFVYVVGVEIGKFSNIEDTKFKEYYTIELLHDNKILLKQNGDYVKFQFNKPILLTPNENYTININLFNLNHYMNGSKIRIMPWTPEDSDFITFMNLSQLLTGIELKCID